MTRKNNMGLRDRAIEWLGAVNTANFDQRINEAYEAGFYDGNDDPATGDFQKGGQGYKRLSDKYVREGVVHFDRAIETAWTLWQKSPIAKRVLAMKRDHIVGHNAQPTTNDEDLAEILKEFWSGNRLDKRASEFTMQLFGFGEQCFPAFVREADGRVRLGYIDPQSIEKIIKHPDNTLEDWAVVVEKRSRGGYTTEKVVYRIIREAEDFSDGDEVTNVEHPGKLVSHKQATVQPWEMEMLADLGRSEYDGSCFYSKVNAVSNQSRGMSDLLQVGDWVDQADDVLFSLADREQFAGYFSFDVTLTGAAGPEQVRDRAKELRASPPDKGSVNVHNESEEWQMFAPDLKQGGSIETFRAVLGLILGGMGFPVHWYGFGDDANRATATAQSDPTSKSLEHDQGIVRDMFVHMCQFAADQAEIAGAYAPDEDDNDITLQLPEVTTRDLTRITASMQALTISLVNGVDAGWITQDTAAEAFAKLLGEMDIQVETGEELRENEDSERQAQLDAEQQRNDTLMTQLSAAGPAINGQASNGNTPSNLESNQGLNGAQITSVLQVLENLGNGTTPPEVAFELLVAVGIHTVRAERMVKATHTAKPTQQTQRELEPSANDNQEAS
jgi:hypothetical protein